MTGTPVTGTLLPPAMLRIAALLAAAVPALSSDSAPPPPPESAAPPPALSVPPLFGPSMVLQRDIVNNLWGWCDCASVTVSFRGTVVTVPVTTGSVWRVALPPTSATAAPSAILVADVQNISNVLNFSDVLFGDVFVCSGQSNMVR